MSNPSVQQMDSLKNRLRVFTVGIMSMVCPVLVAVAFGSDNWKSQGNRFVRRSISPVAGLILEASIVQFLGNHLSLALEGSYPRVSRLLFGVSKLLVHICVVLLMALAALVMNLIGIKSPAGYAVAIAIPLVFTGTLYYMSVLNCENMAVFDEWEGTLQKSADFSAALTVVLFLGLEALAVEALMRNRAHQLDRLLAIPLGLSFATCAIGLVIMLLVSVHPLVTNNEHLLVLLEILNIVLGVGVSLVVFFIAHAAVKDESAVLVFCPVVASGLVWLFFAVVDCQVEPASMDLEAVKPASTDLNAVEPASMDLEKVEPASMDLTKITFAVFLAASVRTASDGSIGNATIAFLGLGAAAIISGLGWRLLTHRSHVTRAVVKAAHAASICSHLCIAAALIPLTMLAVEATKRASKHKLAD